MPHHFLLVRFLIVHSVIVASLLILSAVCFRTHVKEESSPWDKSTNMEKYSACIDNLLESKHAEEVKKKNNTVLVFEY